MAVAGHQAYEVHREYGVWGLSAGAIPPRIPYGGRQYVRGSFGTKSDLALLVRLRPGPDGGEVYGLPPSRLTRMEVLLECRDGTVVVYGLSGGP